MKPFLKTTLFENKKLTNISSLSYHREALEEEIYTVEDLDIKSITIINQSIKLSALESYLPIEGVFVRFLVIAFYTLLLVWIEYSC